jgi:predicted TIM-barrel fold metal-dependent hydrolase
VSGPASRISRRHLLRAGAVSTALPLLAAGASQAQQQNEPEWPVIDTNVSLFRWPFRRLPLDETDVLVTRLQSLGVVQAWAGSFEGLLHRDVAGVNARLAAACREHPLLVPIGSINVELPRWEGDLARCLDGHKMPGVRVHPNYHGYTLDDPRFAELLEKATQAGRFVQVAAAMEDTRTQHPRLQVPDVDLSPLPDVVRRVPGARVQILNARLRGGLLDRLADSGVWFDTARVDGTSGVPQLVEQVGARRVMFGSHAPFLLPEAALIRTHESGELDETGLRAVLSQNARSFAEGRQ